MAHTHGHDCGHSHSHAGHHHHDISGNVPKLLGATALNLIIVVAQVVAGVLGGSLALIADALHNFSDAAIVLVALIAQKISKKKADHFRTFGYRRAQVIGAVINLTAMTVISLFLVGEAVQRFINPQSVNGWIMVGVAAGAAIVNALAATLLASGAKNSINVRAAFLCAITDTMASVGVVVCGLLIVFLNWWWVDPLATLLIACYLFYHSYAMIKQAISILLESVPDGLTVEQIASAAEEISGVRNIHHIHVWQLDEHSNVMEAHVVISPLDAGNLEQIKESVKQRLADQFEIHHATLEIELDEPDSSLPTGDHTTLVPEH